MSFLIFYLFTEGQILHWAVGYGYSEFPILPFCVVVVCVDAPVCHEETPLHLAAKNGFRDPVAVLVQRGGNVSARKFAMQETPLHLAAQIDRQHIAAFLIQHGGQVNVQSLPWLVTPLHLASGNGHQAIAESLIQQGGQVNTTTNLLEETSLLLAAQYVAEMLLKHGSQVDARNRFQETPLHLAAMSGHRYVAEFILTHRSQVDARNRFQEIPLHVAANNGHQQTAELLIHHGSDVSARNKLKESPLHLAAESGHPHITQFLIGRGGLVNARNDPWQDTPLHFAAMNRQGLVTAVLIQHGADHKARNNKKQGPLHLAAQNGHKHVAEVLINKVGYRQKHIADADGGSVATVIIRHQEGFPLILSLLAVIPSIQPTRHWLQTLLDLSLRYGLQTVTSQSQSLHLDLKGDRKLGSILIQHGRNATAQNSLAFNSLLLLVPKNSSRYLCHQKCALCQDFSTQITLCNVAFGSLSGLSWYSDEFGLNGKYGNDSFNGVNTNAFVVPATFLWFEAVCTVTVMTLVLLSWWKCHQREHCLRRFNTLPLRENSSQPKAKELLQPVSHDKQVKECTVIGALHEGCAHYKSTMKAMSGRSTPPFCNDLGMLIQQEHIEVTRAERMERVRTWLECNQHGQEEMASLDSAGNYVVNNPALTTGMIYRLYLHITRQVIQGLVNLEHKVISLFFFFSNLARLTSLAGMIFFFQ